MQVVGVITNDGSEAVIHVTVQDTGIGIPEEKLTIFSASLIRSTPVRTVNLKAPVLGLRSPNNWLG